MMDIRIRKKLKLFDLNMSFSSQGGILGILGASGCGKSMTLKCLAGIETPQEGRIEIGGKTLYDSAQKLNLRPQERSVGYLFQSYALFPHMTVEENIGCTLKRNSKDRQHRIAELIQRFHLHGLEKHYPAQLSGGQQQRAALARIMAGEPKVLLLDEPFSALDLQLKEQLQLELLDMLQVFRGDAILVSHNHDEVYRFCKHLLVMEQGHCIASGETKEIFKAPKLLVVAKLIGCKNFSRAVQIDANTIHAVQWGLDLKVQPPIPPGTDYIAIRPQGFRAASNDSDRANHFSVRYLALLEGPTEWQVQFICSAAQEVQPLYWSLSKDVFLGGLPETIYIAPEQVLLLSSSR